MTDGRDGAGGGRGVLVVRRPVLHGWPRVVVAHVLAFAVIVAVDAALSGWSSVDWARDALIIVAAVIGRLSGPLWDRYGSTPEDVLHTSGRAVVAGTPEEAADVALAWIVNEWNPEWDPAVVKVEDAGSSWRVFYNTRMYIETGAREDGLARNPPLFVQKGTLRDP